MHPMAMVSDRARSSKKVKAPVRGAFTCG
jgi:hypothetical protein